MDNYRIMKSQLSGLIIKTMELGQEIISLADVAIKCLKKLFFTEKVIAQRCLSDAIPALEKFLNVESNTLKEEKKAHLFLCEQNLTK